MTFTRIAAATLLALGATVAQADITIGVAVPMTGPASGLGLPAANGVKLWPESIAGEKLKVILLDDATDPTKGAQNAKKFVTEDKVDVIVGSVATPVAIAMADVALESKTPQLALSPIALPPGKDAWSFRLPQSNDVMANAMVTHMQKQGIKTAAFIGYSDAYGEGWLVALKPRLEKAGIQLLMTERFARSDTSVTAQVLKISAARPDAVIVVASGSVAAMPQLALAERGYNGKVYQTHGAASKDLMRVGGKAVEGTFVTAGPVVAAEQLPDNHPSKALGVKFNAAYEKAYGAGTRNQFAAHAYDAILMLEQVVPVALKKAKPGTPEFRAAIKEALESAQGMAVTHGVLDYTAADHWGFRPDTGVILQVTNGDWKLVK